MLKTELRSDNDGQRPRYKYVDVDVVDIVLLMPLRSN